jgi:hypothetical protein
MLVWGGNAAAQPDRDRLLTAQEAAAALQSAGLAVEDLRQQPVAGSPSGPPATESEAWDFALAGSQERAGRIMVFADGRRLAQKAAWFRRSEADGTLIVHRNVLIWLDPDLAGRDVARYRRALHEIRLGR